MAKDNKKTTSIYRTLINECENLKTFFNNYYSDFMTNLKNDFTNESERKTLREICCEARQACWRSDKSLVFKVGEK